MQKNRLIHSQLGINKEREVEEKDYFASHTFAVGHKQGERGQGEGLFCTCVEFGGIGVASVRRTGSRSVQCSSMFGFFLG